MAERPHPFPSRTRQLSSPAPMVLRFFRGRVGRCQELIIFWRCSRRRRRDGKPHPSPLTFLWRKQKERPLASVLTLWLRYSYFIIEFKEKAVFYANPKCCCSVGRKRILLPRCCICNEVPAEGICGGMKIKRNFLCQKCEEAIVTAYGTIDYNEILGRIKALLDR